MKVARQTTVDDGDGHNVPLRLYVERIFDGHNGFLGAGGKEHAIHTLRRIAGGPDRPDPQAVEDYLLASGQTHAEGAKRARRWYEEILVGKRHRGDRGRSI
jgi:hypothetical protein